MNLRRLELRGFKTFANPTEFLFPSGITALVGPNGSGKSNVADALRWVLGEQSLRAVRGKRTEDVIFAGSASRPPAGMAQVTITLDNAGQWLPLDFSEVTISRRAYRSGDNEYLINSRKVRLRDLNELLLKVGLADSAFAVIGQGMVDVALSIRPEERRALIDEAADIKRFYVKLQETRDKLATTEQGLTRARDLLAEIAPRLSGLAEQAAQLRQHEQLSAELRGLLRQWYRHIALQLMQAMEAASGRLAAAGEEAEALRQRVTAGANRLAGIEREESEALQRLDAWRGEAEQHRRQAEELRRRSAVLLERQETRRKRRMELEDECAGLRQSDEAARQDWAGVAATCTAQEAEVASLREVLAQSEARHAADTRRNEELASRIAQARDEAVRLHERAIALADRQRGLRERREEVAAEAARWQQALAANALRAAEASAREAAVRQEVQSLSAALAALEGQAARLGEETTAGEDVLQQLAAQSRRLARELDERRARLDVLERWRDSNSAYSAGVRAVLRAAATQNGPPPRLGGIVGVAADLLQVPQELEAAIEVALGGRAQDVVVERWSHAEAAIALLKSGGAGRATFLPLDTLRVPGRPGTPLGTGQPGVRGIAADLVQYDHRYQSVVEHLLGRTIVADDLPVARRVLALCPAGWQIVTIDGEIVRSSGAVTGGARKSAEVGLLARQRELRALRQAIAALESEGVEVAARLAKERDRQTARRRQAIALDERRRLGESALRRQETALAEAKAEARALADERRWGDATAARHADEVARLDEQVAAAERELAALEEQSTAGPLALAALEEEWEAHSSTQRDIAEELATRRTQLAVTERELAGRRELLNKLRAGLDQATTRLREKQARLAEVTAAEQAAGDEARSVGAQLAGTVAEIERLDGLIEPAVARLGELNAARRALEADSLACRERLAQVEAGRREAEGEAQRVREQVAQLQQQAGAELGPAVAAELWDEIVEGEEPDVPGGAPPRPEEIKRRIDRVRAALRNLGMVNPQAIAEYEETAARHEFLTAQLSDLDEGAKSLRRLSVELQKTMRRRFEETFSAVAAEFRRYFARLFGGGTARLILTQPEDIEQTGVEIVAQPPGRRLQSLSLLSGGERALTAVALLFAVLAVRPIPFCVLDEVDAALDEANVGRFCEALRDLSQRTQFVLITHNRNTMEFADSLHGISMPADSISQVVSIRLAGDPTGEELEYVESAARHR